MNSILSESTERIKQLIQMIKTVTHFDFSIVDENLKRLLGTGKFHTYENMALPTSTMTANVIITGEFIINHEVKTHDLCKACELSNICEGESTIIYPIKKGDHIIGAISLIGFEDDQKTLLKEKESYYFKYISDLADLIYNISMEKMITRRFERALNVVEKSIIISDAKGDIIYHNKSADVIYKILNNNYSKIKDVFPEYDFHKILAAINDENEFITNIVFENRRYSLTIKKVMSNNTFDVLFLLENEKNTVSITDSDSKKNQLADLNHIIGNSESIMECKCLVLSAASCDSNVLVQGESGTGKEVFVRALHEMSIRKNGPFVAINCSAIPENLIESELFGYEEGAFTGANKGGKKGKFEQANNGTLFLDEIGDMPFHLQAKILRAIEYSQIEKVGSSEPIHLNIRIVAATNKPLEEMIYEKTFRNDLYYRLNVIQINIPPLRERREDILSLARYFLRKFNLKFGKKITGFSKDVEEILLLNDWPGNIRELENALEYAIHVEKTHVILNTSLPKNLVVGRSIAGSVSVGNLKKYEKNSIAELIEIHGNTLEGKRIIAEILGISLSTLYRRMKSLKEY